MLQGAWADRSGRRSGCTRPGSNSSRAFSLRRCLFSNIRFAHAHSKELEEHGKIHHPQSGAADRAGAWFAFAAGENKSVELARRLYDPTCEAVAGPEPGVHGRLREGQGRQGDDQAIARRLGHPARAVRDGLEADVVTLALHSDTDGLRKKGLLADDWEERLPNRSLPYHSTIVFVVRKGNPRGIKDWNDLVKGEVKIITTNPKTSGNGKLSFLAAWGAGSSAAAPTRTPGVVSQLVSAVPVLDLGLAATTTFAQKGVGDVHLTWENEAHREVQEARERWRSSIRR